MKRLLFAVSILLFLCCAPCMAQSMSGQTVRVNVPFDFIYNDTSYPAGQYMIKLETAGDKIFIGNADQWMVISHTTDILRGSPNTETHLVFSDKDGKHYLHQVWIQGETHGHDLLHKTMDEDVH